MSVGSEVRGGSILRREFRVPPLRPWLSHNRDALILGIGAVFRVAQYLANRTPWLDESALAATIRHSTLAGLFGPLRNTQLAPAGFLVVEWLAGRAAGGSLYALRLLPLVGGLASLWLFARLARRVLLRPRAVTLALALFAVSNDPIYFASELKPYSTDVAMALVGSLLAVALGSRALTVRLALGCGVLGASLLWFSFPTAFILAGAGIVLMASALLDRDWRRAGLLLLMGAFWVGSIAILHLVAMDQLGHKDDMWKFWAFAFLPWPPTTSWEATWPLRRFLYLFVNPLDFATPLGPRLSALPAVAFFLLGGLSLLNRDRRLFGMLVLPGLLVLFASAPRLYPFHGRLLLFLVPSLLLLIAEGADRVLARVEQPALRAALLATLLLFPTLQASYHLFVPRARWDINGRGDLRNPTLNPERFPF